MTTALEGGDPPSALYNQRIARPNGATTASRRRATPLAPPRVPALPPA